MSEADKIFNELDFDRFDYIRYIEYFHKKSKLYICFDSKTETVEICGYDAINKQINIELFNAIFLKKRELGWIGDDK